MAKAKGGTGRGTGKKGWTRWQKGELKKQKPLRIVKANKAASDAAKASGGSKEVTGTKMKNDRV